MGKEVQRAVWKNTSELIIQRKEEKHPDRQNSMKKGRKTEETMGHHDTASNLICLEERGGELQEEIC